MCILKFVSIIDFNDNLLSDSKLSVLHEVTISSGLVQDSIERQKEESLNEEQLSFDEPTQSLSVSQDVSILDFAYQQTTSTDRIYPLSYSTMEWMNISPTFRNEDCVLFVFEDAYLLNDDEYTIYNLQKDYSRFRVDMEVFVHSDTNKVSCISLKLHDETRLVTIETPTVSIADPEDFYTLNCTYRLCIDFVGDNIWTDLEQHGFEKDNYNEEWYRYEHFHGYHLQ